MTAMDNLVSRRGPVTAMDNAPVPPAWSQMGEVVGESSQEGRGRWSGGRGGSRRKGTRDPE